MAARTVVAVSLEIVTVMGAMVM